MDKNVSDRLRVNIETVMDSKRVQKTELADNAGIHYDTLRKFLNGSSDMTMMKIERIADALGMTVVGLINYRGK